MQLNIWTFPGMNFGGIYRLFVWIAMLMRFISGDLSHQWDLSHTCPVGQVCEITIWTSQAETLEPKFTLWCA